MNNLIRLLMLLVCLKNVLCDTGKMCSFTTCGECISSTEGCVWCSKKELNIRDHCKPISVLADTEWCKGDYINPPKNTILETNNLTFSDTMNGAKIQVMPQKIKMRVRPGNTVNFDMHYKPAEDYPLDIYFLMDTSFTMRSRIKEVTDQATKIQKALQNYTNNVRLGLGTFVEKPGFPYVDLNHGHKAHAFLNYVSLTNDTDYFSKNIPVETLFGANYDDPEAGLDALMQAMLCDDEIGWRDESRRIIVLCTDSTYHSAGDGKMIGIIKPNDMQCHYKNNTFTTEMTMDYPSVSQIKKVASERNFMIIFAATEEVRDEYTALAKLLVNAEYTQQDPEGGTVLKVIKASYEKMAQQARMNHIKPSFIDLVSNQDCEKNINCHVPHNSSVTVSWNLTVTSCPSSIEEPYTVVINPAGLSDKLVIELDLVCKCDECETDGIDLKKLDPLCNNKGVLQCGVCKCQPGRSGYLCQCDGTSDDNDWNKCLAGNDTQQCNGNGICKCGKCECTPPFDGAFCEFNNEACEMAYGVLCNGHGKCERQQCVCDYGWTGDSCSCPTSTDRCKAPYSNEECSGHGDCNCGKCDCHRHNNESYWGDFCDQCDECQEKICTELEKYVLCVYNNNKTHCDTLFKDEKNNIGDTKVTFVNETEINDDKYKMAKRCMAKHENGNYVIFKFEYNTRDLILIIQKEQKSPPVAEILIPAGYTILAVLLIGLATVIIWKVLVDLHDKREYEKFAAESAAEGFDVSQNAIYVAPATVFNNPAYDAKK